MPKYSVDVWGTSPEPENYQIEAEDEQEAIAEAKEYSSFLMITNVEAREMTLH